MKIKDIIGEGFWKGFASGLAKGVKPAAIKNLPDLPKHGTEFASQAEYCQQAAAKYGFPPDECGGMPSQAPAAASTQQRRIPQQIEVGNSTLTRMAGGDWYDMATNTLITDPNIIARADKRWAIQQQNLQMTPGYQQMSPITGFRRKGASKRTARS